MPAWAAEITATYTDIQTSTIHVREGGGTGYIDATFDDTWIKTDPATDDTYQPVAKVILAASYEKLFCPAPASRRLDKTLGFAYVFAP